MIFLTVDRNAKLNNRTSFNFTVCDSFIKLLKIHYVPSMQKSVLTKWFLCINSLIQPTTVEWATHLLNVHSKNCYFWHCIVLYHSINLSDASYLLSCRHLVIHIVLCDFIKHVQLNKIEIEIQEQLFTGGHVQYPKHKVKMVN